MPPETREKILDSAIELFLQHGYKRTTVDDIAAATGISKGSVYLHFDSKETVFGAASERVCRQGLTLMAQVAASGGTVEQRIHRMLLETQLYVWDLCHRWSLSMEQWAEILTAAAKYTEPAHEAARRIIAELIAEGQAAGLFDPTVDPANVAWLIQLALQGFEEPSPLIRDRRQIEEHLPQLVELLIRALKRPGRKECDGPCQ